MASRDSSIEKLLRACALFGNSRPTTLFENDIAASFQNVLVALVHD
jgi:hypothetical protein